MAADFHTHILPGIDDGSSGVEESLKMLSLLSAQGIHTVAVTPHFYANHSDPHRFLERRQAAWRQLRQALSGGEPEIRLGAEVHYFEGISDCDALEALSLSDTGCLLVEMPPPPWSGRMLGELEAIRHKRGLIPIVAHIDRYIAPFRTHGIPERLAELPVLVQANASFFLHRGTRSMALRMLRSGQIHLLGSDCHNTGDRPPNMGPALALIASRLGQAALDELTSLERQLLR